MIFFIEPAKARDRRKFGFIFLMGSRIMPIEGTHGREFFMTDLTLKLISGNRFLFSHITVLQV